MLIGGRPSPSTHMTHAKLSPASFTQPRPELKQQVSLQRSRSSPEEICEEASFAQPESDLQEQPSKEDRSLSDSAALLMPPSPHDGCPRDSTLELFSPNAEMGVSLDSPQRFSSAVPLGQSQGHSATAGGPSPAQAQL